LPYTTLFRSRLEPGIDGGQLANSDHRDEREHEHPADLDPDLDAEDAGDGDAHQGPTPDAERTAVWRAAPARRPASTAVSTATASATAPTAIAVSDQNCSGKSWTNRSVRGSKE